uniref:Glycosyltransferase 2-like domain-containing protein n=1 Tax=Campylobacter jejuni TaxID=197 RepID=B0ZTR0_CAMJU|nr:unknown [Campylobacter jejuni]
MVCLSPYDYHEKGYIFSKEIDDDPNKARITTSLLKFPKQSEFGKLLIEEAKKIVDNRKTIPWGVIGPWFLAKWVKECGLEKHALDYKDTCQIPWKNARDFIDKKKTFDENRPCLHLFSEMWRSYKMNKNHFYLKETIYGQLLDRHKIQNLLNRLSFTKNQTKTVGVVIPIYNVEKYLRECLDSVVNQTYKNLQVVLVNDGSTDENSLNIAKEYTLKDERFILFDKENGGQSTARNVGIEFFSKEYDFKNITQELKENSLVEFKLDNEDNPYNIYKIYKSSNFFKNKDELLNFKAPDIDYIIFLDSDDYWELNCIEECVPRMDGVDILWFKEKVVNQTFKDISTTSIFDKYFTGRNIITKFEWIERQFIKDDFFQFVCFGVINFHFLKKISLMFENYIIGEDRIFGILLFLQSNFIYMLEKELYVYRIRDYSSCNYSNKKILPPPIYVLEFGNVKNIHLHIDVLSNIRMLLSLIAYLKDNTIDLESKLICEKLFIPSFYRNISQSIFKCSKISIEYKISFF